MKRIFAAILALVMMMTLLSGCGELVEIQLGGTDDSKTEASQIDSQKPTKNDSENSQSDSDVTVEVDVDSDSEDEGGEDSEAQSQASQVVDNRTIDEKYADAAAAYKNVKGWISIPNSYVDHAIVQTTDNSYYLDKNLSGSYYYYGSVFANCDNQMDSAGSLDQNTVLFGHNKNDGILFGNLVKYENLSWAQNHPFVYTVVDGVKLTWMVVAAMDCETSFHYIGTSLSDSTIQSICDRSFIDVGYNVSSGDKLLTLSTCTYDYRYPSGAYREDVRFVVVCALVPEGTAAPAMSVNSDRVEPTF